MHVDVGNWVGEIALGVEDHRNLLVQAGLGWMNAQEEASVPERGIVSRVTEDIQYSGLWSSSPTIAWLEAKYQGGLPDIDEHHKYHGGDDPHLLVQHEGAGHQAVLSREVVDREELREGWLHVHRQPSLASPGDGHHPRHPGQRLPHHELLYQINRTISRGKISS